MVLGTGRARAREAGPPGPHRRPADRRCHRWCGRVRGRRGFTVAAGPCPLAAMPLVPSDYIVLREDATLSPAWCRQAARDRLGVEPRELPGGHSPFITQPVELADLLVGLTGA